MSVHIYASGPLCCSACAPNDMDAAAVAEAVNAINPAGTEHGWQVSADPTFRTGQPNPCRCEASDDRRHWLLDC